MNFPSMSFEQANLIGKQLEADIPYYSEGLDILRRILETENKEEFAELCKQNGLEGASMNKIVSCQIITSDLLNAIQNYLKDLRSFKKPTS